jgi:hypothetical protein
MKSKILWTMGAVVVVALIAAYIVGEFFLGSIVVKGVNRLGPQLTQTKVTLAGANISPFSGSGTLHSLHVGNPRGWKSEEAFSFEEIHIEVLPRSLLGHHIVVNDLTIDRPVFVYETKVMSSNISDLLDNISGNSSSGKVDSEATKSGEPIKYEIKHFRVTNGRVILGVGPAALKIPMPPIDITNIGTSQGGIPASQIAVALMRSMSASIVEATTQAAGKLGKTMGAAARQRIKDLFGGKQQPQQ